MNDVGVKKDLIQGKHGTGTNKKAKLTFLGMERLVDHLAAILNRAGARTIRTILPDRVVQIAVDEEEMATAFAGLAARDAAVTILGGIVPIEAGVENQDTGCALL